ncbi:Hypothetical predicted protein, partial [Marmota monax]
PIEIPDCANIPTQRREQSELSLRAPSHLQAQQPSSGAGSRSPPLSQRFAYGLLLEPGCGRAESGGGRSNLNPSVDCNSEKGEGEREKGPEEEAAFTSLQ